MSAVYKSICFEADTVLLHAIKLAEKHINLKLEIEKLMNEGYVKIAKARYIMGGTCVTKMQLPTENSSPIQPLATVGTREEEDNTIFYIIRQSPASSKESIVESNNGEVMEDPGECMESREDLNEQNFKFVLETDPKSLKKSKTAYLVQNDHYRECNDELLDEMSNPDSNESLISVTDPLRLFGILVPSALREAQVLFSNAVNLLGDCSTVQLELRETVTKLGHLQKVKKLIEGAAKQTKYDFLTPKVYWTPSERSSVSCYSSSQTETEEEVESTTPSTVKVKSIRSVFYDNKDLYDIPQGELQIWGSGGSVNSGVSSEQDDDV